MRFDDMEQLARLHLLEQRVDALLTYFTRQYEPIEFVTDSTAK